MQPTYMRDHAALPPVASAIGRTFVRSCEAPAVVKGTPLDDALLQAAIDECDMRKLHARHGRVTDQEVLQARIRVHSILSEHAAAQYGGDEMPVAVGVEVDTVLGPILQRLDELREGDTAQHRGIKRELERIRGEIYQLKNAVRRMWNQEIVRLAAEDPSKHYRLQRYVKVDEAGVKFRIDRARHVPDVRVGDEYPSPPFPATVRDLEKMTINQIVQLALMMKDDFGIVASDDVNACRVKVRRALLSVF